MEEFNRNLGFLADDLIHQDPEDILRAKNFCKNFIRENYVDNLPYIISIFLDNDIEFIKSLPDNILEPNKENFLVHCYRCKNSELELFYFICGKFADKITIPLEFRANDKIDLIVATKNVFGDKINEHIDFILASSIISGACDVFDFIVENIEIDEEKFMGYLRLFFTNIRKVNVSTYDIFYRFITKFSHILVSLNNWSICCDFPTYKLLNKFYLGHKVNPIHFSHETKFLRKYKERLQLNEFIQKKWENPENMFLRFGYEIIRITMIIEDYFPNMEVIETIILLRNGPFARVRNRVYSAETLRIIQPFFERFPEGRRQEIANFLLYRR